MKRILSGNSQVRAAQHQSDSARRHGAPGTVRIFETEEDIADTPFEEGAHDRLDPDLRHRMISEAAYHLYAQRGYVDGYDLDDWLQAEAAVDHVSLHPDREQTADTPPTKLQRARLLTS